MKKHALLLNVFLFLFILISDCQSEDNCSGNGGIVVNEVLYNEITVEVGEIFSFDLFGTSPLFTHPDGLSISVSILQSDSSIADVFLDRNTENKTLSITGVKKGSFELILRAVDECAGELSPVSKSILITII